MLPECDLPLAPLLRRPGLFTVFPALGPPQRVVETILRFHEAGARHIVLDFVGPYEERDRQIERFASEAMPLLAGLRGRR